MAKGWVMMERSWRKGVRSLCSEAAVRASSTRWLRGMTVGLWARMRAMVSEGVFGWLRSRDFQRWCQEANSGSWKGGVSSDEVLERVRKVLVKSCF